MGKFNGFVVFALCASLLFNFNILSKLNNLEGRVNHLTNMQSSVVSSVNSQAHQVSSIMDDIRREQSWISPITRDIQLTDVEQGKGIVTLGWQIKEFSPGAQVVLNYKLGESGGYTEVPGVAKGNGVFEGSVPFEVELRPQWHIDIHDRFNEGRAGERTKEIRIIEERKHRAQMEREQMHLRYFVTMTQGGLVKSSEIAGTVIDSLGYSIYGVLEVYSYIDNNNNYTITVVADNDYSHQGVKLQEVYLKKYKGGQFTEEERLRVDESGRFVVPTRGTELVFSTQSPSGKLEEDTRLVIKVVYQDGATFEEEIYW